jgi:GTP-binding protein EngB required for normal cell division
MSNLDEAYDLRAKYTRFRILVIGRANAGKTTLLQRVCNTTEDPCIFDDNGKNLLEPTAARGIHDIYRPFAFRSNPQFIFHDSPGFESGDEKQLQDVLSFIEQKSKSTEVDDQLHAIWFCLVLNKSRPLFPLETAFFETARAGKVPVIAIFTKFDDLMYQVCDMDDMDLDDMDLDDNATRRIAEKEVEEKFRKPLNACTFPPRADVCFEALHTDETGKHQDQVKALIEKTASSLDDTALKMLFVSVQQNNINLSVRYAIHYVTEGIKRRDIEDVATRTMLWFGHSYVPKYNYDRTEDLDDDWFVRTVKQNARALSDILYANFKSNDFGLPSTNSSLEMTPLCIFTALLICMENSFWNRHTGGNFVEWFQKSFALYVESGKRKKVDVAIKTSGYDSAGPQRPGFTEDFLKIIMDHYLPRPENQTVA